MIQESYVSFECAKLLKEKKFDLNNIELKVKDKISCYSSNGKFHVLDSYEMEYLRQIHHYSFYVFAPTQQMAMRWLREVHKLAIQTGYNYEGWFCTIDNISTQEADFKWESKFYNLYEEAVEAAIKYCLENLI